VGHGRLPRGRRTRPAVQSRRTTETPYPGVRSGLETTQASPAIAVAQGVGLTVSSTRRAPRSQPHQVRQGRSRRVGPDPSAGSRLVTRAWATGGQASAQATHVAAGREDRQAVR
jgi:hypothetical protein